MFEIHINAPIIEIPIFGGIQMPVTLLTAMTASLIIILFAGIIRVFLIPKFKDQPSRLQMLLEMAVDGVQSYTDSKVGAWAGKSLAPYIFTVAIFLLTNGLLELFGVRASMTDINCTIALALITFALIQVFSIRKNGLWGRLKRLGKPTPLLFPIKLATELAVPISLSCRLFGNILGGMIVMELLYSIIVVKWTGIPGLLSIYFTIFHTAMQTFIFITLSLTFIEEGIE